ncbi:N-acetylneuraminate lyase, partial [Staphylococcus felis]|nr:N-acetylneuraminate lyase [Staphylococcus felis]
KVQHETNDIIPTILRMGLYPTIKAILSEKVIETGQPKAPFQPFNENYR